MTNLDTFYEDMPSMLGRSETASLLCISPVYLDQLRREERLPAGMCVRLPSGRYRYRTRLVVRFMEARRR